MTRLEEEFGDPNAICAAYVRKLEKTVRVKAYDVDALKSYSNFLDNCYETLLGLNRVSKLNDSSIINQAMDVLPMNLKTGFLKEIRKLRDRADEPTFKDLVNFVKRNSRALGDPVFGLKPQTSFKPDTRSRFKSYGNTTNTTDFSSTNTSTSTTTKPKPDPYCIYCGNNGHWMEHCDTLRKKPITERREFLRRKRICERCAHKGHEVHNCPNTWKTCNICQKGHITIFHPEEMKSTSNTTNRHTGDHFEDLAHITLGYLRHRDTPDQLTECYIYSDTESDSCWLDANFASDHEWKGDNLTIELTTMHGTKPIESQLINNLEIVNFDKSEVFSLPTCFIRETLPISRHQIPTKQAANVFPHLQHISKKIPDTSTAPIALMIGRNVPLATSPREVIPPTSATSPWAERNGLGWSILYAKRPTHITCNYVTVRNPTTDTDNILAIAEKESAKDTTTKDILRLFDQDFIEDKPETTGPSKEDERFINIAHNSINLSSNHYTVDLPFRHDPPNLKANKYLAISSLDRLKKKFKKDDKYAAEYTKKMEEAIKSGHIMKIPDTHLTSTTPYYLTHHGVFHKHKKTLRVVFNASLRNETSLNDELLKGPDYLINLAGTLARMRKHNIAFTCDIASMFMMVKVPKYQRDYVRILWWNNGDTSQPPDEYHICYHLFGAVSSPSCCIFALQQTAYDNMNDYSKDVTDFILTDFYMDDGCTSTDNLEDAIRIAEGAIDLCQRGGFNLCKFVSNSKEFLYNLPADKRSPDLKDFDFDLDDLPHQRTLGMIWDTEHDLLKYRLNMPDLETTRRGCLSSLSTIFDPMGLISPLILPGKRILQNACHLKLQWDEPLPFHLQQDWLKWKSGLQDLHRISIPRCHKPSQFGNVVDYELHCFSDACTIGYGCCAFLRLENDNGDVEVCLVMGKSRVVPIKPITIPRLELTGAVTMVNIYLLLQRELKIDNLKTYFWTDSTCVLGYLRNESRRFKTFVSNRIQRILNHSELDQWHHVKGHLNPADFASRGVKSAKDLQDSIWFTGPNYLYDKDKFWLTPDRYSFNIDDSDAEIKTTFRVMTTATKPRNIFHDAFLKISSWNSLRITIAVWNHLASIYKSRHQGVRLNPKFNRSMDTLQLAELFIIRLIQQEAFPEEIDALNQDTNIKKSSSIVRLSPFLDDNGILRIGGRIKHSSLKYEEKHLIILPKRGHLIKLLVRHYHERCHHSGRNITLNLIRSRYWLINGSSAVQHFIAGCVTCTKLRGRPLTQRMSDLPPDRLDEAPPFTNSACDIFGPFLIKVRRSEVKRYGLLFSCQTSRAVHLEVLHTMTTDSFLCGLRRFICRRGAVKLIRSDRGSQILGASNELEKLKADLDTDKLQSTILQHFDCDIIFKPSTPYAPHFHGSWERQIGSVRRILEALLLQHKTYLTDESLETFLVEAEAVINSRPLTVESISDPELKPLSPSNLLTLKTGIILPPPGNFVRQDIYLHKQWRKAQFLANEFWVRWRREVLQTYQERQKWNRPVRNLKIGDVVLVMDDNLPRNHWLMMIVDKVHFSDDGLIRKVDVATTKDINGNLQRVVYTRAVHKLILLVPNGCK